MTLLTVNKLEVSIAAAKAVAGISFTLAAGETFCLLGESGCGKSMTALALMRLLPDAARISGGVISFNGDPLFAKTEAEMRDVRGAGMAMIFQEPATSLNPVMTVGAQISEVLVRHLHLPRVECRRRSVELLRTVGMPDADRRFDEYPFQLSGGMKQRAMIAMALAGEPRLLIADEPTTALDVTIQAQVLDLLQKIQRERGMGMLLITHDLGVVSRMADRIGVMYGGELVEVAVRDEFFAVPRHPYSRKLFAALPERAARGQRLATIPGSVPPLGEQPAGCRFAARCSEVMPVCREQSPAWRQTSDGRGVRCHLYQSNNAPEFAPEETQGAFTTVEQSSDAAMLRVNELQMYFPIRRGILQRTVGHVRAVDGVSFALNAGRTLALVGESGCGKTTVGKAVLQLLQPTGGRVALHGQELVGMSAQRLRPLRAKMQMVFQDPFASLNPRLRVGEIIAEGMQALGQTGNMKERVGKLLEQVGLRADMAGRFPHEFSGGQRQRIAIARALAVKPQLLICDEPTSALDVSVQAQILNLLRDLQQQLGLAYLFITHNIAVVGFLADEVAVMYLGRIVEQGAVAAVLESPAHPYTQALLAAVPQIDGKRGGGTVLAGDMPSPANPPSGCHFHPRCSQVMDICRQRYPQQTILPSGQRVCCHVHGEGMPESK